MKRKIPWLYLSFMVPVICTWSYYMFSTQSFHLFLKHYYAVITMVVGSFIAGSSPEGSAAIAYPIFTLYMKIPPPVARNFAFAIQSIGMTSASLLILSLKIKVEWNYIRYVTFGGIFGLVFGTYYIVPLISPPLAKLFFVSLWLSFGLVLWYNNRKSQHEVFDSIENFRKKDMLQLVVLGLIGGMISSIFGTGINIFSFCFMTIYYRINEKVAIPSSVIIMTIETLLGIFLHSLVIQDFQQQAFEMWLVCVPFVVFFAPLGAYVVSKVPRKAAATFLYIILIVQFFGAMWVLRPDILHLIISFMVLLSGILFFTFLSRRKRNIIHHLPEA